MDNETTRIVILGAGPIGLEAALYARYLGYQVTVVESGTPAQNVRHWGHWRMFSPFGLNRSTLGVAALVAQDPSYRPPDDDALLTGLEWAERYLCPLAQSDLVVDCIQTGSRAVSIKYQSVQDQEGAGDSEQPEMVFKVLIETERDGPTELDADVVIDATGLYGKPRYLSGDELPADGELSCQPSIDYYVPNLLGDDRNRFQGRRVLVVGSGYSAATAVVALSELAAADPSTSVVWATRCLMGQQQTGPVPVIEDDPLAERAALARRANQLAAQGNVHHLPETRVATIRFDQARDRFAVAFAGQQDAIEEFDRVIAAVGFRPEFGIYPGIQFNPPNVSPPMLMTPQRNLYILGAKSSGDSSSFSFSTGIEQIRELFSVLGERTDLDLYATHR